MAFGQISGATGELRAGGRTLARLVNWVAVRNGEADTWTIGGGLVDGNPIWLAGAEAMDVCLDVGAQQWRWRRVPRADIDLNGDSISVLARGRFER
ncbi:MAG: hypothetical protein VW405_00835 [Rhodospirillaceae bacterium]